MLEILKMIVIKLRDVKGFTLKIDQIVYVIILQFHTIYSFKALIVLHSLKIKINKI